MTVTVSPYVVWGVLSLALFGMVFVWRVARDAARDLWAWARRDRVGPLLEDEPQFCECCEALGFDPYAGLEGGYCRGCGHWHGELLELPPERSREELGFTGSDRNADDLMDGGGFWHVPHAPESAEVRQWRGLEARRERLASAAELEHRAAYEACGFEFPSGLMARVREAAP